MAPGHVGPVRKMIIAPIIFCTVVSGIAHVADAAKVGRVALKAILYFEVISTLALLLGLLVAELLPACEAGGYDEWLAVP